MATQKTKNLIAGGKYAASVVSPDGAFPSDYECIEIPIAVEIAEFNSII